MSIGWCKKQGMKLVEPNDNLAEEYYKNAEETLRITNLIKNSGSNMWLAEILLSVRIALDTITPTQIKNIREIIKKVTDR